MPCCASAVLLTCPCISRIFCSMACGGGAGGTCSLGVLEAAAGMMAHQCDWNGCSIQHDTSSFTASLSRTDACCTAALPLGTGSASGPPQWVARGCPSARCWPTCCAFLIRTSSIMSTFLSRLRFSISSCRPPYWPTCKASTMLWKMLEAGAHAGPSNQHATGLLGLGKSRGANQSCTSRTVYQLVVRCNRSWVTSACQLDTNNKAACKHHCTSTTLYAPLQLVVMLRPESCCDSGTKRWASCGEFRGASPCGHG